MEGGVIDTSIVTVGEVILLKRNICTVPLGDVENVRARGIIFNIPNYVNMHVNTLEIICLCARLLNIPISKQIHE